MPPTLTQHLDHLDFHTVTSGFLASSQHTGLSVMLSDVSVEALQFVLCSREPIQTASTHPKSRLTNRYT